MERSKSLKLHLTEVELETLIDAVHKTSDGGFAELELKLRAALRSGLPHVVGTHRGAVGIDESNIVDHNLLTRDEAAERSSC